MDSGQATILSALIGGAIALVLAQFVNRREDRYRFVADKRQLYWAYLKAMHDALPELVGVSDRVKDDSDAARARALAVFKRADALEAEIGLLGSPEVVSASADCRTNARAMLAAAERHAVALQSDPSDVSAAWHSVKETGDHLTTAMDEFQGQARRDLGVFAGRLRWPW